MPWGALIVAALPKLLTWVLGLMGGGKDKAVDNARELGRAEQQNDDMKGGMATVRAANDAARRAEQQEPTDVDPNDRASRG